MNAHQHPGWLLGLSFAGRIALLAAGHIAIANSQALPRFFSYKGDVIFCNFARPSTTFDVTIVGKGVENILNISKNFYPEYRQESLLQGQYNMLCDCP
ncbi:hypothetical protein KCU81_g128, partial [Aureobasidium melanogenum]